MPRWAGRPVVWGGPARRWIDKTGRLKKLVCRHASSVCSAPNFSSAPQPFLRELTQWRTQIYTILIETDQFSAVQLLSQRCCSPPTAAAIVSMRARSLALLLAVRAAAEPVERREIRSVDEFRRLVQTSPRVFLVEFFSGMCGYCQEFEPTWLELARTTTRLEPARVNIDMPGGLAVAELVGVINEGIPAVVLFNQRRTDAHATLMAGELEELPKLLRRVYKNTKGQYLSTDAEGFFLRAS